MQKLLLSMSLFTCYLRLLPNVVFYRSGGGELILWCPEVVLYLIQPGVYFLGLSCITLVTSVMLTMCIFSFSAMSLFASFLVLLLILVEAAPPTASSIPTLGKYHFMINIIFCK